MWCSFFWHRPESLLEVSQILQFCPGRHLIGECNVQPLVGSYTQEASFQLKQWSLRFAEQKKRPGSSLIVQKNANIEMDGDRNFENNLWVVHRELKKFEQNEVDMVPEECEVAFLEFVEML